MEIIIQKDAQTASRMVARIIARKVRNKPNTVLGLATGGSPLMIYAELIRMHHEEGLDFSEAVTFNLDEYAGLPNDHPHSYHTFMWEHLFSQINIKPNNVHIPDGLSVNIPDSCAAYEQAIADAGGIDLQLLGIGANGHIGFNEPTSSFASRTRIKTLSQQTIKDNACFFGGDKANVPRHCVTMGIGTIMEAQRMVLIAFGSNKADAVAAMVEGPVSAMMPASILQHHPAVTVLVDTAAAAALKRPEYYRWIYEAKPEWQHNG